MKYELRCTVDEGTGCPVIEICDAEQGERAGVVSISSAVRAAYWDYYGIHLASSPGAVKIKYRRSLQKARPVSSRILPSLLHKAGKTMYVSPGDKLVLGRREITLIPSLYNSNIRSDSK